MAPIVVRLLASAALLGCPLVSGAAGGETCEAGECAAPARRGHNMLQKAYPKAGHSEAQEEEQRDEKEEPNLEDKLEKEAIPSPGESLEQTQEQQGALAAAELAAQEAEHELPANSLLQDAAAGKNTKRSNRCEKCRKLTPALEKQAKQLEEKCGEAEDCKLQLASLKATVDKCKAWCA
mmetsp:Transcript_96881/g.274007  ORF Transcript_96881/g.274007 Transcript_96881/m.274007 type:complete len:179 (+) Transcript_96881:79-615(+)